MPSFRCQYLDKWLHKGQISQEEYDKAIKKLDGHDAELLKAKENLIEQYKWERDVAISQLEEIGAGLGLDMKLWLKEHDSELLDKVVEKLKADIEKYWYRSELDMSADNVNCLIDEVIEEMKSEMSSTSSL